MNTWTLDSSFTALKTLDRDLSNNNANNKQQHPNLNPSGNQLSKGTHPSYIYDK